MIRRWDRTLAEYASDLIQEYISAIFRNGSYVGQSLVRDGQAVYYRPMETWIVRNNKISKAELRALAHEQYGDLIKAVVDVAQKIMGVGGEFHSDIQSLLVEKEGSRGDTTWGINLYLDKEGDGFIEFDSMINLKPASGNRSRGVEDMHIQNDIRSIVAHLVA